MNGTRFVEIFSKTENCGTGAGGFKKGNTCAKGLSSPLPEPKRERTKREKQFIDFYKSRNVGWRIVRGDYSNRHGNKIAGSTAWYDPESKSVYMNKDAEVWGEKGYDLILMGYMNGFFSSDHPDRTLHHEYAHFLHHERTGYSFNEFQNWNLPSNIGDITSISQYAKKDIYEFVAELYTVMKLGVMRVGRHQTTEYVPQLFDIRAIRFYHIIGGPPVPEHPQYRKIMKEKGYSSKFNSKKAFAALKAVSATNESQFEHFERDPCGDSSGGFEQDNTCASGGSSHIQSEKISSNIKKFSSKIKELAPNLGIGPKSGRWFQNVYDREADDVIAAFYDEKKSIYFNHNHPYFEDPAGQMERLHDRGFLSSPHENHVIFHEIGHAKHWESIGQQQYDEYHFEEVDPKYHDIIKEHVSRYAASNPLEFVAEVYAGSMAGIDYNDRDKMIMIYYDLLGGPEIPENKEEFLKQDLMGLIQRFAKAASGPNCGTGSGGFKAGNKCALGSGWLKPPESPAKPAKNPEKSKAASASPPPSFPAQSTSRPKAETSATKLAKSSNVVRSLKKFTESPALKAQSDSIQKGMTPPKQEELSHRSILALKHYKPVTMEKREGANKSERDIAEAMGGEWLTGYRPADAVIGSGKHRIGLEVKTEFENSQGMLKVDNGAIYRKADWVWSGKVKRFDTIILKSSTGEIFYKRGTASYSMNAMYKVKDVNQLKRLILLPDNKLPAAAKMTNGTMYHKAITDYKFFLNELKPKAEAADLAKKLRRDKSKAKVKLAAARSE